MSIPFDQYQRYKTFELLVNYTRDFYDKPTLTILEVGSNEQFNLLEFLPTDNITFSDLTLPDILPENVTFIQADATDLKQFEDSSFDIVLSSDVLEHIPNNKRDNFLKETNRVARLASFHCFPNNTIFVRDAEKRCNEYYKFLYNEEHPWLIEHIKNGLPDKEEICSLLDKNNITYTCFEHGDVLLWEKLTRNITLFNYYNMKKVPFRDNIDKIYKEHIYLHDKSNYNYRIFLVSSFDSRFCQEVKIEFNHIFTEYPDKYALSILEHELSEAKTYNSDNSLLPQENHLTIFFDTGNGFNELEKKTYHYICYNNNALLDFEISIPPRTRKLRFDCIEGRYCLLKMLSFINNNRNLEYRILNGQQFENTILFLNTDPQIEIPIKPEITLLRIKAEIEICYSNNLDVLMNMLDQNFTKIKRDLLNIAELQTNNELLRKENDKKIDIINQLSSKNTFLDNKIMELKNKIIELDKLENTVFNLKKENEYNVQKNVQMKKDLDYYILHYKTAMMQRSNLEQQLYRVIQDNQSLMTSTSWKITKPIRDTKLFLKKQKDTHRTLEYGWKVIWNLKNNGFRYTVTKVKNFIRKTPYKVKELSNEERIIQENTKFSKNIKFSIIVPLYNTPKMFLLEMIQSCLQQTYSNWELCLADGSDEEHNYIKKEVKKFQKNDARILYKKLEKNLGISENTNAALEMATGEYIALFDHDDLLHPSVLYEYMKVICEKGADFIYCDEDKVSEDGKNYFDPHFKPDFAIDTLRTNNYICHFLVFKKELLQKTGLFRKEFDGSQDHDMILRLVSNTNNIIHIPKILYHWRVNPNSTASDPFAKSYTAENGIKAIKEDLKRHHLNGTVESCSFHPNYYRIRYKIVGNPLVSILIPNKEHKVDLERCISSIIQKTTYTNYEIIVVENSSADPEIFKYYAQLEKYSNIKIITYNPLKNEFNYSAINNYGIQFTNGEHIIFLNNDIEIISPDWIEEMLMFSQRNDIGAVGAKLYYPNNTIQHAGVIIGMCGLAGHAHRNFPRNSNGYFGRCNIQQNLSAVTAACLMMKKQVFLEIGGFDEEYLKVAFNDVDLCMKVRKAGYLIVWTPFAEAYHYESISRGLEDTEEKQKRFQGEIMAFKNRWKKELENGDPYYNSNLTLDREDFSIK